jgi:alpha-L-fucosidase 2
MATFNEMLLQSEDGIIRVFPAIPDSWENVSFKLGAVGAFVVTATKKAGAIHPILIESLKGGTCQFQSPWGWDDINIRDISTGHLVPITMARDSGSFETRPCSSYLIFRKGEKELEPGLPLPRHGPNMAPKAWQGNRIGMERFF